MRFLMLALAALSLSACATTDPCPPGPTITITRDVPVPVLCTVEIQRVQAEIDTVEIGTPLEKQNATLRSSIASQKEYIKKLESGVIGCGGKISNP